MINYNEVPAVIKQVVFPLSEVAFPVMEKVYQDLLKVSPNCVAIAVLGSFANGGMNLRQHFGTNRTYTTDFDMVPVYDTPPASEESQAVANWANTYFEAMPFQEKKQLVPFLRTEPVKKFDFCKIIKYRAQFRTVCPPLSRLQQDTREDFLPTFSLTDALEPQYPLDYWQQQVSEVTTYLHWLHQNHKSLWWHTIQGIAYNYSTRKKLKAEYFFAGRQFKSTAAEIRRTNELIRTLTTEKWQLFLNWLQQTASTDQPNLAVLFPGWVLQKLGD